MGEKHTRIDNSRHSIRRKLKRDLRKKRLEERGLARAEREGLLAPPQALKAVAPRLGGTAPRLIAILVAAHREAT